MQRILCGSWGEGPAQSTPVPCPHCPLFTVHCVLCVATVGPYARFIDLMLQCTYYPSGGPSYCPLIPWRCVAICHVPPSIHSPIHPPGAPTPQIHRRRLGGYISIRVSHISAKLIDCGSLGLHSFGGWWIVVRCLRRPKSWLENG